MDILHWGVILMSSSTRAPPSSVVVPPRAYIILRLNGNNTNCLIGCRVYTYRIIGGECMVAAIEFIE